MIGMTGIIINDSIVLVSTIDQYSEKRGLYPAIIDAVADRLRPVFLTTATTVMGLAPLLYERSSQAEFLRPTVITLVYGLGFGMVLVLVLVPAILAAQADLGRQFTAFRRGLFVKSGPAARSRVLLGAAAAGVAALFAATIGTVAVSGALPSAILTFAPALADRSALGTSFALFMIGSVAVVLLTYLAGLVLLRRVSPQAELP
jgi:predicted RND superfamily exporter protein